MVRTGSDTANGQLVRSILYPKNYGFHLYADSIKFLFLMFLIAFIGTCVSVYLYIIHGVSSSFCDMDIHLHNKLNTLYFLSFLLEIKFLELCHWILKKERDYYKLQSKMLSFD